MTYEPLHHKYRPQTFADLVGQEAIATTLTNAIEQRRIAPAYLFTGPRGTGKTSSARILAKSLNCLTSDVPTAKPCGVCEVCKAIAKDACLDVIEIDAASNTGVDNIREIIEKAQFAPVQCRYKVYCIDECHMLSSAAFNALLKTLEEPPKQVVFVLATTDPQRVLATIISRCQRFDFRRIPLAAMVNHLQAIAATENIDINDEAIALVAQVAQGGLRDAESLLDQLSLLPHQVGVEQVWDLVGTVPERNLLELLKAIASSDLEAILSITRYLLDRGREPLIVLQNLVGFYRDLAIAKTAPNRNDLVPITAPTWQAMCQEAQNWQLETILAGQKHLKESEAQIKNTTQPRLWLEVTLLGLGQFQEFRSSVVGAQGIAPVQEFKNQKAFVGAVFASPVISQPSTIRSNPPCPTDNSNKESEVQEFRSSEVRSQKSEVRSQESAIEAQSFVPVRELEGEKPKEPEDKNVEEPDNKETQEPKEELLTQRSELNSPPSPHLPISPSPSSQPDLEQLWEQAIARVQSPATQALLTQHCYLLAFDGQQAQIGVSTQPLLKHAQTKLAGIEAAFQSITQGHVKVSLQVAVRQESKNSGSPPPASQPQTRAAFEPSSTNGASTQPVAEQHIPQTSPPKQETPQVRSSPSEDVSLPNAPPRPQSISYQSLEWETSEVAIASKSLAQFFGGEIISLGDELAIEEPSPLPMAKPFANAIEPMAIEPDEIDDDDVPF
jgi:DNA polymerase-3 subunit gamma/tau